MSAAGATAGHARPVVRRREHGVVRALEALAGGALYSAYVALRLPALALPVLALATGVAAVLLLEGGPARASRARAAAWGSAHLVVLAVLHARALPADAPYAPIQLGLAAFVVATSALSLVPAPRRRAWVTTLAPALGLALAVTAPAGQAIAGVAAGLLAGVRPWSAFAAARGRDGNDGWLWWSPTIEASDATARGRR